MNFTQIMETCKKIKSISSTNEKKEFLASITDEDFKNFLKWEFDGSIISGLSEKKINKVLTDDMFDEGDWTTCDMKTIFDVFKYLENHKTGTDNDIKTVQWYRKQICKNDEEKEFFNRVVTRNLPLGFDVKILNKAIPNLVPTWDCCLCAKYYDKPSLVDGTREFGISVKIDGNRGIIVKENGNVKIISRQGKIWEGLIEVEEDIKNLKADNIVFDGELTIDDFVKYPSKDVYKMTSKLISTKDKEKRGITFNVFDCMSLSDWNKKDCSFTYKERHDKLRDILSSTEHKHLNLVEDIYVGNDPSKIEEFMKGIVRTDDWEGLVIKFLDSKYSWKRTNDWLKVKAFDEMDLIIRGVEEGTNANKGRLGALICDIEHPTLGHIEAKVGSGYSEDERIRFYTMKDELIGRVISVQYFEQTENTTTHVKSLRFPVFLELKEEGQEPNN